jgi:hypothetical protein
LIATLISAGAPSSRQATVLLFKLLRRELDALLLRKARAPETWPEREEEGAAVLETVRALIGRY